MEVECGEQCVGEVALLRRKQKADLSDQFLRSNRLEVVARYDGFMIQAVAVPTMTSVCSPRLMDVIGATVTQAR